MRSAFTVGKRACAAGPTSKTRHQVQRDGRVPMTFTKKLLATLVAGACAATIATSASAAPIVIVDLFTDPAGGQIVLDTTADASPVVSSTAGGFASIIGGQRDVAV